MRANLATIPAVCRGGAEAGPIGELPQRGRFHWLVSPRSTIIQISPVHTGRTERSCGLPGAFARQSGEATMKRLIRSSCPPILCASAILTAQTLDLSRYQIVDLSHAYGAGTLYWPTSTSKFKLVQRGQRPDRRRLLLCRRQR